MRECKACNQDLKRVFLLRRPRPVVNSLRLDNLGNELPGTGYKRPEHPPNPMKGLAWQALTVPSFIIFPRPSGFTLPPSVHPPSHYTGHITALNFVAVVPPDTGGDDLEQRKEWSFRRDVGSARPMSTLSVKSSRAFHLRFISEHFFVSFF